MTTLELKLGGSTTTQPSSNPQVQSSSTSSPNTPNFGKQAEHMVFVLAAIMGVIYGLKVFGRVLRKSEK